MALDPSTLDCFEASLARCLAVPDFLDRFYDSFLESSPKVREKFKGTRMERQKAALAQSFHLLLRAACDESSHDENLRDLAELHSGRNLGVGAELYDYWLDSLLKTVAECDPKHSTAVHDAWDRVMMVGIRYMLLHY